MTDCNWPNPERPGEPMFPERDGWHVLQYYVVRNGNELPMGDPVLNWWEANSSVWRLKPDGILYSRPDQVASDTVKYSATALTPAQINEMLAAERERIKSMVVRACNLGNIITASQRDMIIAGIDSETAIRNLGAAP